MIAVTPTPRADMERRAAASTARREAATARGPALSPRNIGPILSLGETEYFLFRGSPYGVPPLPWKQAERLSDVHTRALSIASAITQGALRSEPPEPAQHRAYFAAMRDLAGILWSLCRPVGRFRRALRFLGMHRNPFTLATERELLEIADFFFSRRTRSGVTYPTPTPTRARGTFSTTS